MLNVKYGIMGQEGRETFPVPNPHAYGNGWFVKDVRYVANADEEILGLHQVNPKETALVAEKYKDVLGGTEGRQPVDSLSTVKLTAYDANALTYEVNSPNGGVVVFSEIYYPGWQATVDGQPVEIACADYILRDNKRCINVFVHADIEERVKTVMNRQHISEQEARELIRKMDKTRPNYYNFYSDKEWGVASY